MKKTIFLNLVLLLVTSALAPAATRLVPDQYPTIQDAIDAAVDGDTVIVAPGTYTGDGNRDIDFLGKAITVRSTDPNDPNIVAATVVDCERTSRGFAFMSGEGPDSVLAGLTITNGLAHGGWPANNGGGIYCSGSSPTIANCIITDNMSNRGGGIACLTESSPTITNCTITGNSAGIGGAAIYCYYNSSSTITNCILWGNEAQDGPEIHLSWYSNASVSYSDVQGGQDNVYVSSGAASTLNWGLGNIDQDPRFAFGTDYHLMPGSACIDAGTNTPAGGLPTTDIDGNPRSLDGNGDGTAVADIGAYEFNPHSPSIAVSSVSFYYVQGDPKPAPQTLLIRNCSGGTLNWEIIEACNWLEAMPTNGVSTSQVNKVTLMVDPNGLAPGYYSCILRVIDPNAANSPVTVQVPLHVGVLLRVPEHFPTIQAAIDTAADYDVVFVADGTYAGPGNRDIDFLGKAITVRSENGPANCIIDCNGTDSDPHRAFYFHSGEDATSVLDGFTIINGYATYSGGAIYCLSSSPTIANCTITGNSAKSGGAIRCQYSSPTIANCTITNNTAQEGGAIGCRYSILNVTSCTISGNSAGYSGGAIFCTHGSPTIANCTITGNTALYGGAINCRNKVSSTVTNCTISGNSVERGGAIYCFSGSSSTLTNCTITGNTATKYGGAICCFGDSSSTLTNCILWGNSESEIEGSAVVTYSNVQGGWPGEGNIDDDPCFIEPGFWADANDPNIVVEPNDPNAVWVEGDYHLWPDSPCINAGDPNYEAEPNETDLDGSPRVIGNAVDMGAYEFSYVEASMNFTPQVLNPISQGKWAKAHLVLPESFDVNDVDVNSPAKLWPLGIESDYINAFINEDGLVEIEIAFGRSSFCAATDYGITEVTVIGLLTSGQYFYGTDTIKILDKSFEYLGVLASYWLESECGEPDYCDGVDLNEDSVVNFKDFSMMLDGCCAEVSSE